MSSVCGAVPTQGGTTTHDAILLLTWISKAFVECILDPQTACCLSCPRQVLIKWFKQSINFHDYSALRLYINYGIFRHYDGYNCNEQGAVFGNVNGKGYVLGRAFLSNILANRGPCAEQLLYWFDWYIYIYIYSQCRDMRMPNSGYTFMFWHIWLFYMLQGPNHYFDNLRKKIPILLSHGLH